MKLSVGHAVPETSAVTVIGVVVASRGRICSEENPVSDAGATSDVVDGAVGRTPRFDPHATRHNEPTNNPPLSDAVRANLTCTLLEINRSIVTDCQTELHAACHTSSVHRKKRPCKQLQLKTVSRMFMT